jgi:hypothetical protein
VPKGGGIPEGWAAKPAKLSQKDRDARWTLKPGRRKKSPDGKRMVEIATPMFGYKSHIGIDQRHGFIRTWGASDAARSKVRSAVERLCHTETPHGPVHPHNRHRAGQGKDRPRQHRVQLQTLHLLGNSNKRRMIAPPT